MLRNFYLFIILMIFLTACASDELAKTSDSPLSPSTVASSPTLFVAPSEAPPPSKTTTSTSTVTPLPPTATSTSTRTPIPTATPVEMAVPESVMDWLESNVIPFEGAEPNQGCDDLEPFLERIGDARIVALGEGTHGTHEFFNMKYRLVQCLVMEKDFRLFAIEANLPEVEKINAYVHGEGGWFSNLLYGIWDTEEVKGMTDWMRQYNQNAGGGEKVSFQGFDMQYADQAVDDLYAYLEITDAETEQEVRQLLDCYRNYVHNREGYSRLSSDNKLACRENMQTVFDLLVERQPVLERATSSTEFAYALHMIRILQQHEIMFAETAIGLSSQWRDTFMAENVSWLLEQGGPRAKIILWAHNGHIESEPGQVNSAESNLLGLPVGYQTASMGVHLRQQFGDDYLAVGLSFGDGSFNAVTFDTPSGSVTQNLAPIEAQPPLFNSHEQYLMKLPFSQFILDLRQAAKDPVIMDWLAEPRWLRAIGWAYDPDNLELTSGWTVLPQAYDFLIHFQHTTPSELLH